MQLDKLLLCLKQLSSFCWPDLKVITDYHPSSNLAVLAPAQFSHKLKVVLGIGVLSLDDKRGTQQTRQFDIFSGIYNYIQVPASQIPLLRLGSSLVIYPALLLGSMYIWTLLNQLNRSCNYNGENSWYRNFNFKRPQLTNLKIFWISAGAKILGFHTRTLS